jgi:hypothetical protein
MSNQVSPNQALVKAVHAVANQRLKEAANAIKAAASQKNATIAQRNATIANLEKKLREAGQAAKAANVVAPGVPAAPAAQTAEIQAVNAVNKIIKNIGEGIYNNRLKTNPFANFSNVNGYNAARKNNISRAAAARVNSFPPPLPPRPKPSP